MSDDKKNDAVSIEEHNKIVATANARQAELEVMKRQNEELKQRIDESQKSSDAVKSLRDEWAKEQSEVKKELDEIRRNADNTKVIKGLVKGTDNTGSSTPDVLSQIKKLLPDRNKNPERYASNIARWGHYKNPTTKVYGRDQLGMALSLHGSAQQTTRNLIAPSARAERSDIILTPN